MGAAVAVAAPVSVALTPRVLCAVQASTRLAPEELEMLGCHFRTVQGGECISSAMASSPEGGIDRIKFQQALGLPAKEAMYIDRMFLLMDKDNDGLITFTEFVQLVALLSTKATLQEKIALSFQIMDLDADGKLSKDDVHQLLHTSITENNIHLTKDQVAQIIDHTFTDIDADKDGFVSIDEYSTFAARNEGCLNHLTLNLSYLLNLTTTQSSLNLIQ